MLLLPVTLLAVCSLRCPDEHKDVLWLGTVFQVLGVVLAFVSWQGMRHPLSPAIIMLYVIALSWLLLGTSGTIDPFVHVAQAVLLVVPLGFFGLQCLSDSGAPALRRATQLGQQLAVRRDWPADLNACRQLPEVKVLREALHIDAQPALNLLSNPRPEVRVAALAALEFREEWRKGQAEIVLNIAQRSQEPALRAAAISALANIDDRNMVEALAEFLHDPSPVVRQAATEALLWDIENRWPWIRNAVRIALGDPNGQADGPLRHDASLYPADAVADLTGWASEKGLLGMRAAQTIASHYAQALALKHDAALITEMRRQVADVHAPAMLRLELARLLLQQGEMDKTLLKQLIEPSCPAPMRLLAVEALLAEEESGEAIAALHDLARLPNREIALAVADVVQRRLGQDMGLPRNGTMPPIHTRQAAEVARRVMYWASHSDVPEEVPNLEEPSWRSPAEM
jgi:HEAT repeats